MNVLILSCGTGGGHNAAGRAIEKELIKRGHTVSFMNPYDLKSNKISGFIDNLYVKMVQGCPSLFGIIYKIGNLYRGIPVKSPVYYANWKMAEVLNKYLMENKVDYIVMPHLYPAEIISCMKAKGYSVPPTMFIGTDYTCIPFTEETACDYYVIPQKELIGAYLEKGFEREKLYPFGIPVDSRFSSKMDKEKIYEKLGLAKNKKYILITGGSMGAGCVKRVVDILYNYYKGSNVSLIVVSGSNKGLFKTLRTKYKDKIKVVGHTNNMAAYMKISEMILTKPGGLTSTEAAVAQIPIVHINPIPGCEIINAKYFEEKHMSIVGKADISICHTCQRVLNGEGREMIENQGEMINKKAAWDICNFMEKTL